MVSANREGVNLHSLAKVFMLFHYIPYDLNILCAAVPLV